MALIECPECRNNVSDTARKCPSCGYKMKRGNMKAIVVVVICIIAVLVASAVLLLSNPKVAEPTPIYIPVTSSNLRDFVDLDATFSGFSKSYASSIYFGDATLEIECKPLEEVVFHDVSFSLEFKTGILSDLADWDIPNINIRLSELGRASTAKECSYVSIMGSAKSPIANGNYWIKNVTGTVEVKPDSPFYSMAKELFSATPSPANVTITTTPQPIN